MKNFILSLAAIALLTGCKAQQSFIALNPYAPTSASSTQTRSVIIAGVTDERSNKDVIATITSGSGDVSEYVVLNTDVAGYFKNALIAELRSRGIGISGESNIVANVAITELKANMSGFASDNTKGNIKVRLIAQKGNEQITKNFADNQTKFELIRTASAFEPMLKSMIDDMVRRVADALAAL